MTGVAVGSVRAITSAVGDCASIGRIAAVACPFNQFVWQNSFYLLVHYQNFKSLLITLPVQKINGGFGRKIPGDTNGMSQPWNPSCALLFSSSCRPSFKARILLALAIIMAVASLRMARGGGLAGNRDGQDWRSDGQAGLDGAGKTMASPTARMVRAASRVAVMPGVRIGGTIRVG